MLQLLWFLGLVMDQQGSVSFNIAVNLLLVPTWPGLARLLNSVSCQNDGAQACRNQNRRLLQKTNTCL